MTVDPTTLQLIWFGLIAVLWVGFLVLEGFDFGVGMLIPTLGWTDKDRRVMVNTIGPLFDGNEVWLITAAGAMFAAFPGWYATMFSAMYLPFFLVLLGLIIRGLSVHFRSKRPEYAWKNRWDWGACLGSYLLSMMFGISFANFVIGLPVTVGPKAGVHVFTGGLGSLFSPFALLGGIVLTVLFMFHGAIFIALKTRDAIHDRANGFAGRIGVVAVLATTIFLLWSNLAYGSGVIGWLLLVVALGGLIAGVASVWRDRDGWAFVGSAVATAAITLGFFVRMFPNLGFDSSATPGRPLNVVTAAASPGTLQIMTWAAVIFIPLILGSQAWSYWVFRKRIGTHNIPDDAAAH